MIVPKDILSPSISLSRYSLKASFQTISNVISIFSEILSHWYCCSVSYNFCCAIIIVKTYQRCIGMYLCMRQFNSKYRELIVLIIISPALQTHFKCIPETFSVLCCSLIPQCPLIRSIQVELFLKNTIW